MQRESNKKIRKQIPRDKIKKNQLSAHDSNHD